MLNLELQESLKNGDLTQFLNPKEVEMLFAHNQIVKYFPGEMILQQGKQSNAIYFIFKGNVNVTAKILGEGSISLETLGPGNFLGEVSFIEKIPSSASIIASEEVLCLMISSTYIDTLSAYFPETKFKFYQILAKQVVSRLRKMHDKIISVISNAEMTTQSIFSEIIQSMTKPIELSCEGDNNELYQLQMFSKDEIELIYKYASLIKAPKNCTLIHKGDKESSCYIVLNGAVQSSIVHDNKVAKLSVIGPVTLLASIGCADKNPAFTITFVTCEKAVLLKLSESSLISIQNNHITLWYKIFDLICKSLVALEKSVDKLDVRLNIENYNR